MSFLFFCLMMRDAEHDNNDSNFELSIRVESLALGTARVGSRKNKNETSFTFANQQLSAGQHFRMRIIHLGSRKGLLKKRSGSMKWASSRSCTFVSPSERTGIAARPPFHGEVASSGYLFELWLASECAGHLRTTRPSRSERAEMLSLASRSQPAGRTANQPTARRQLAPLDTKRVCSAEEEEERVTTSMLIWLKELMVVAVQRSASGLSSSSRNAVRSTSLSTAERHTTYLWLALNYRLDSNRAAIPDSSARALCEDAAPLMAPR